MTSVPVLSSTQVEDFLLFIQSLTQNAPSLLDLNGKVTAWTPGAEILLGWSAREIVGMPFATLYPKSSASDGLPDRDLDIAKRKAIFRTEALRVHKDGSEFLADIIIVPLCNPDGSLRGFGHNISDVTKRRQTERQLAESELHVRSILATVPSAMIVIDEEGRVVSFSAAAERMFGYSEDELIGENVRILMPANHSKRHDDYLRRYLTTKEKRIIGVDRVVVGKRRDGTEFPMELSVGEAGGEAQKIFTGFMRDLTAQQQAELRLKELQSELIQISRASAIGTMASTLAHELNQPLAAIASYSNGCINRLGGDGFDRAEILDIQHRIARQAHRAGEIIRRVHDFVRRAEPQRAPLDLNAVIRDAVGLIDADARKRQMRIISELAPALPTVQADAVMIEQIIVNLVRNGMDAMRDTPIARRQVHIRTLLEGRNVQVRISDRGSGIPPETAIRLFEPFFTTKPEGMGMGLNICRSIAELHHGRLTFAADPEGGTLFTLSLPVDPA